MADINVTEEIIDINVTEEVVNIIAPSGGYPLPNTINSVFGRVGNIVATEGDYTLTQLGDVTLTSPANGQVLKYNGTSWVNDSDAGVTGSGTTNTLPKFTGASTIGNSNVSDSGAVITLGSDFTNINGFSGGGFTRVLPAGNTFGGLANGATGTFTGSANGWSIVSRQTWNINDDAFTFNGFTANDTRIVVNRSATSANGYTAFQGLIQNSGSATQGAAYGIYIANTSGNGNFGSVIAYKVGAAGTPSNTGTYTNYWAFQSNFLPLNIANFYGLEINDYTATTLARALNLNMAAGANKWNIYAGGSANNYVAGSLGIGVTNLTGVNLYVAKNITGAAAAYGVIQQGVVQSDVTTSGYGFYNQLNTQAASFTTNYSHFLAVQNSIGAGSAITTQVGYNVASNLTSATNNYGFRGQIPSGANRWNLYMDGTAANYLAGDTAIGTTTLGTATMLTVSGTETAVSAISRGQLINTTLVASANGDALVALDIAPTFTLGGFTNVSQFSIRASGTIRGGIFDSASNLRLSSGNSSYIGFLLNQTALEVGRFHATTGNFTLQNGGAFTDAGFRLDVQGTARITGAASFSSSVTSTTLNSGKITLTGNNANSYLPFTINNTAQTNQYMTIDVMGATAYGVSGWDNSTVIEAVSNGDATGTRGLVLSAYNGPIIFQSNTRSEKMRLFTTGNLTLQNGGTFTDAGFRLDVNGTTRIIGTAATDSPGLGSELLTTSNWTSTGWTGDFTVGFTHTTGNTSVLSNTLAAVIGTYYKIQITMTGRTAGSITIGFGGQSRSVSNTRSFEPLATTTGNLTITPTSDFNGTIIVSVRTIGLASPNVTISPSTGSGQITMRATNVGNNTVIGLEAGQRLSSSGVGDDGTNNTFFGYRAGRNSTQVRYNTFIGCQAGEFTATGTDNTAVGFRALYTNTVGLENTAIGRNAGENSTGNSNAFLGTYAGQNLLTGASNLFIGSNAGRFITGGSTANTIANNSIFIGTNTRAAADNQYNQIVIGDGITGLGANTTIIGTTVTTITGLYGNIRLVSGMGTAPASATATGTTGDIVVTAGFIYVCTATNTWVRTALTTW
jgi:hypothetical protein